MNRLTGLFAPRLSAVETLLFCYVIGVTGTAGIGASLLDRIALPLLVLAAAVSGYTLWRTVRPVSPSARLLLGASLLVAALQAALLYAFGTEAGSFRITALHGGVTESGRDAYLGHQLILFAFHTAASALLAALLMALFRPDKRPAVYTFFLTWLAMPLLFLLMHLIGRLLRFAAHADMLTLFVGWLLLTAAVAVGSYRLMHGHPYKVVLFTLMTFAAPPLGAAAFVLFYFLQTVVPVPDAGAGDAEEGERRNARFARQLSDAEKTLHFQTAALAALERKIGAVDRGSTGAATVLKTLEKEKTECLKRKLAAEAACERLRSRRKKSGSDDADHHRAGRDEGERFDP